MDEIIKLEPLRSGRREHQAIHLRLLETDMPDFPVRLPTPVDLTIVDTSLSIGFTEAEESMTLDAPDILGLHLFEESRGILQIARLEYRDPFEVVYAFNFFFGSDKPYWIKAFGKTISEKLDIEVSDATFDYPY